jgi:MFS family permease
MASRVSASDHFGPVALSAGVLPRHVLSFIVAALVAISLTVFVNVLQPYILSEHLHVAPGIRGRVSSGLVVLQETIALLLVGVLGSWSDHVGRRFVFAGGMLIVCLGLAIYPLCTSLGALVAARCIVALGAVGIAATLAGIAADYPRNDSRGRLLGILLFTQQIGIVLLVANLGSRLPRALQAAGFDAVSAGRWAFWLVAAIGLAGVLVAARGLRGPAAVQRAAHEPVQGALARLRASLSELRLVAREARGRPRLALVFPIAIVARGDAAIAISFLSLWIVTTAQADGVPTAVALARVGTIVSVFTVAALASTVTTGFVIDRVDRARAATVAAFAAGLTCVASLLVDSVMGSGMLVFAAALGISEAALIISGQALLGEGAAPERRGATVGAFGFCGSLGVLLITGVAGQLFDRWTHAGPFILVGVANLLVATWAFGVRHRMAPAVEVPA